VSLLLAIALVFVLPPLAIVAAVAVFAMFLSDDGGDHRSGPVFWVAVLLTSALVGITMYMAHLRQGPIPTWCWIAVAILFAVILALRRFLKSR
jgi:hypothetical protein